MNAATATLFLDTRKEKKNGKYPVKLTIYFLEDKDRFTTKIDLTEDEWKKLHQPKLRDNYLKEIKLKLEVIKKKANDIINELDEDFSFEEFRKYFQNKRLDHKANSFLTLMEEYIENLKSEERLGTAASMKTTYNRLKKFKETIRISEITQLFLKRYEISMRNGGLAEASIGMSLRNVRTITNYAINKKLLRQDKYPFKGYDIPVSRNIKKALPWSEVQKLINAKPKTAAQEKALDLWTFSYLCNGMNMKDIAYLQVSNLDGDLLTFEREKTKRTKKRNTLPIRVALHPRAMAIINKYQSLDNPYLFCILKPGMSAVNRRNKIQTLIWKINRQLEKIAEDAEIILPPKVDLTTYVARHTFATVLKRKGVPIDEISEYLGHQSVETTKHYLDSFESETLRKRILMLTD